jgi:hypothetical protein
MITCSNNVNSTTTISTLYKYRMMNTVSKQYGYGYMYLPFIHVVFLLSTASKDEIRQSSVSVTKTVNKLAVGHPPQHHLGTSHRREVVSGARGVPAVVQRSPVVACNPVYIERSIWKRWTNQGFVRALATVASLVRT